MRGTKDLIGWVVTVGLLIATVMLYFNVPYIATELIMVSSYLLGLYTAFCIDDKNTYITR